MYRGKGEGAGDWLLASVRRMQPRTFYVPTRRAEELLVLPCLVGLTAGMRMRTPGATTLFDWLCISAPSLRSMFCILVSE